MPSAATSSWWAFGVLYQIYPRSFQDSDGDGVGDLRGIIERLPYLSQLGVDAIWLSPVFPSPMADFGYDVADYVGIDPIFGTMTDFDALVDATHAAGLKLILDLVPNHSSDQHPWFLESRSSRDNPKRDWYLWRDPKPDGSAPNNWLSEFGGSGWEYDSHTEQYYYHAFLRDQPDLNWRHPDVRAAIYDSMRFWLRKGVDGFRVDVIWHLIKDDKFRDNPPNPEFRPGQPPHAALLPVYSADRLDTLEVVAQMRSVIDEFSDRVLIGEIYLPVERLVAYYGENLAGAQMPFNFALLSTPWRAENIAALINRYEAALPQGAWPNWVLGNHDRARIASRVGDAQARVAAMLILTLRGTPTLYYGDEIGLRQQPIPPELVRDPFEKNVPGIGVGRDGCRTPMQWDDSTHAGFSAAEPWLPVAAEFAAQNVVALNAAPQSILNLYRALLRLRRQRPELSLGDYVAVEARGDVLTYRRGCHGSVLLVALNLGAEPVSISTGELAPGSVILMSTALDRDGEPVVERLALRGHEGVIVGAV